MRIIDGNSPMLDRIFQRATAEDKEITEQVAEIIALVRNEGDQAVCRLNERFSGCVMTPEQLVVSVEERESAYQSVNGDFLAALRLAIENITVFHQRQLSRSWFQTGDNGVLLGQMARPIRRAGIYAPGGKAAYPSSVLMNAIPAKVAGVPEIALTTPPDAQGRINPHTLVAASELGIKEIYKAGGAQAIAALAYGTSLLPGVDKITGPGNIYVTSAKRQVYGKVDIDMLAGPSEVLIIADETANPAHVAADLLSQAEHDEMAAMVLLTPSETLAGQVLEMVCAQAKLLPKQRIINSSLENNGAIVVTDNLAQAFELANRYAPEHLELMIETPFAWLDRVENAGALFLGHYSPEPVGDYIAGPNHILPTGGTARFYSALGVDSFIKKTSIISYTPAGLREISEQLIKLAEVEGLAAHANAVRMRMLDNDEIV